jgi:hypothetical protein
MSYACQTDTLPLSHTFKPRLNTTLSSHWLFPLSLPFFPNSIHRAFKFQLMYFSVKSPQGDSLYGLFLCLDFFSFFKVVHNFLQTYFHWLYYNLCQVVLTSLTSWC